MTYRSRTVTKRPRRSGWDSASRRNLYLNVGFGLVIFVALAILAGLGVSSWYSDHWASAAKVNGTSISKDDVRARAAVDKVRLDQQQQLYQKLRNKGAITSDDYSTATQAITTAEGSLADNALTELEDDIIVRGLAAQRGVSVNDQQVAAQITKDGTIAAQRHIQVIGVQPEASSGASVVSAADVATAKTQAQTYHDQITKDGKKWADVAKTANAGAVPGTGDIGLLQADSTALDPDLLQAAFKLAKDGVTDVMRGQDGVFRFATVTDIVDAQSNPDFQKAIQDAGVSLDDYRQAARGEALKEALKQNVLAQYVGKPSEQRHVQEILIQTSTSSAGPQVHARVLVFAPNHDLNNAQNVTATDPAWTDAQKRAQTAYDDLSSGKSTMNDLANTVSDLKPGPSALGPAGDMGWVDSASLSQSLPELSTALFAGNLKPGEILKPVKTTIAYIVAQYVTQRAPAPNRIAAAQLELNTGHDFAQVAQKYSDAPDASAGGDLGWVARYQLDPSLETEIFKLGVGQTSGPITSGNGLYLFKVTEVKTRLPDGVQADLLRQQVYDKWYADQKAKASITTDPAGVGNLLGSAAPS